MAGSTGSSTGGEEEGRTESDDTASNAGGIGTEGGAVPHPERIRHGLRERADGLIHGVSGCRCR